ncbi:hypothetical protein T492DRAFT_1151990 [Pavlovales sp. CCMP2436]|nr:hypothetical protein T492DRAFT_1151990 [Pavlovales sp. CCMP2436]
MAFRGRAAATDDWETDSSFENDLSDAERLRFGNQETAALYREERQTGLIASQQMHVIREDALARDARSASSGLQTNNKCGYGGQFGLEPAANQLSAASRRVSSAAPASQSTPTPQPPAGGAAPAPISPRRKDGTSVLPFKASGGVSSRARAAEQRAAASVALALDGALGRARAANTPSRGSVSRHIAALGARTAAAEKSPPAANRSGGADGGAGADTGSGGTAVDRLSFSFAAAALSAAAEAPIPALPPPLPPPQQAQPLPPPQPHVQPPPPLAKPLAVSKAVAQWDQAVAQCVPPRPSAAPSAPQFSRSGSGSGSVFRGSAQPPPPPAASGSYPAPAGSKQLAAPPAPTQPPPPPPPPASYPPGTRVAVAAEAALDVEQVESIPHSRNGRVLSVRPDGPGGWQSKVSYDGYDSDQDEWLGPAALAARVCELSQEEAKQAVSKGTTAHCLPPSRRAASQERAASPPPPPPPPDTPPPPTANGPAWAAPGQAQSGAPACANPAAATSPAASAASAGLSSQPSLLRRLGQNSAKIADAQADADSAGEEEWA